MDTNFRFFLLMLTCLFFTAPVAHSADTKKTPFYLTMGYSLSHQLYRSEWSSISNLSPPVRYNTEAVYPNNLSGLRLGFGAKLGSSKSRFGYELDYNQVFAKTRTTPGFYTTKAEKIALGFIDYELNPEASRLHWLIATGGIITNAVSTLKTLDPNPPSWSSSESTAINPAIAGVVLYPINSSFSLKGVFIWMITPYSNASHGTLIPLLMFNYYP